MLSVTVRSCAVETTTIFVVVTADQMTTVFVVVIADQNESCV